MGLFSRKQKTVKEVQRFDGPGQWRDKDGNGCAYFNIYAHEDGSCHTIEFDRLGAHVAEYDGEPSLPDVAAPEPLADGTPPRSKGADVPKAKG